MRLPEQVTSLIISQTLKNLGVRQDSYFEWKRYANVGWSIGKTQSMAHETDFVAAYTTAELECMLPSQIIHNNIIYSLVTIKKPNDDIQTGYDTINDSWVSSLFRVTCKNSADSRAQVLVFLLENNFINK